MAVKFDPILDDVRENDGVWGAITGNLENQTDLQTILDSLIESGESIFFFEDEADPDITGYKVMDNPAQLESEAFVTESSVADEAIIQEWITDVGLPGVTFIPDGIWEIHFNAYKTGGTKEVRIYNEIYKRNLAGTETLLGTTENSIILTTTETALPTFNIYIAGQALLATDRIVTKTRMRLIGGGSNPTSVTLGYSGSTGARLSFPAQSVDVTQFVRITADQTVAGVKTFSSSPIVPTPTTDFQPATKEYVDDGLALYIPTSDYTDFVNVAGDIMTGNLILDKSAGVDRLLDFTTGNLSRWQVASSNQAEAGANAGSNFFINRFSDAGAYIASPFIIDRATGALTLEVDLGIAHGGTGASDAAGARYNLGLSAGEAGDIWVEKAGDTMTGALNVNSQHILPLTGEVVFNETGADIDFRIESDTVTNALIVDGETGAVGINRAVVANRVIAVGGSSDFYGELNMVVTGENTGAFKAYKAGESAARFQFTNQGDVQWGGGSGAADTTLIRRAANRLQTYGDFHIGDYSAPTIKLNGVTGYIGIKDGITAPSAETGFARIYVDTADGDLKVKFADGFVATLAVDS